VFTADVYREPIANWTFDSGYDGWTQNNISGYGFLWNYYSGGVVSDTYFGYYAPNSRTLLTSPSIDCRNYVATEITALGMGSLGLGVELGIYSGTSVETASVSSILTGNIARYITRSISAINQSIGRVYCLFTSDYYYNSYFGILDAEVTGIPVYGGYDGTSFAAPVVAGVAAMLMSQNPQLTHLQVKDIILQTARKVSALNGKVVSGGVVDAAAALREAKARIVVTPAVTSSTSASGTVGSSFSYSITASSTPTTYNASSLPSGLSVNTSTGVISGTPSSAGTFTSSISASNIAGTGSASLTIAIAKGTPTITVDPTASTITYGQTLASSTLSGGSASVAGNFSWTTTSAVPAAGTSAQNVTFTPSDTANYNTATTSVSVTAIQAPPPPPRGLVITSDLAAVSINLGASFSHQITASGSPTSFGAIRLPPGLKINAKSGLISGKPTKVGVSSATLQALKKGSTTATATKVFTVVQAPTFSYAPRINAQRNKNVNVKPKVAGSPAPSFSVVSGSLPPGLSLNASTAAITGKPTTAGSYPFTVRGSNSAGNSDRSTTIVVK
jgi:hypothetical protein